MSRSKSRRNVSKPREAAGETASPPKAVARLPLRRWFAALGLAAIALLAAGLVFADWWTCLPETATAGYVGRNSCIACHQQQHDAWQGSHHDKAMDLATEKTVLGDFDDAELEHFGVRSKMFRRDGKYMVHTEGPDGKMADFEVKYVFGVDPLQNYMVEFDRPADLPADQIARVQVLRISWDTQKKKWFYLSPPDVQERLAPDDELHWTGIAQRWNHMCADCHSTNLKRNYDVASGRYHTTFSEIDVSCEACHGPGSLHVQLAESRSLFWDRKRGYGLARLKGEGRAEAEIQACAPCHSRRRIVCPDFQAGDNYFDFFQNGLLDEMTYHADGQILDEVYEYGSFTQSKMYHKGIRCTDCHDPHSAKLKHQGNAVCTSCHQHSPGKYDGPAHHHHQPDSPAAKCVDCHMPESIYMDVDPRRDHSLRIPRPDLSVEIGTPNACTRCHLELEKSQGKLPAALAERPDLSRYQDWIAAAQRDDAAVKTELARIDAAMHKAVREWYGENAERRGPHYGQALAAARRDAPGAESRLIELAKSGRVPAIVRATAAMELGRFGTRSSTAALIEALGDPDPQVRAAAAANLQGQPAEELVRPLLPLLEDSSRLVRTEAARTLAAVPRSDMRGRDRDLLQAALDEFERGQLVNSDRAASHMTLGIVAETRGDDAGAIAAYRTAMRVEPSVTGPRTNLAAVFDRLAENAQRQVQQAVQARNETAGLQAAEKAAEFHEQATHWRREELDLLARDVRLLTRDGHPLPGSAALQYRYGMSLYLHKRFDEAEQALLTASQLEPNDPQFLLGLVLFYKERNQPAAALPLARRLVELRPDEAMYRQVLAEIQQQPRAAGP